ncbi:MAG TPA: glutathione peroxidase [Steroidobacteraceae bacterium]|jgi:glutathione peroxidase
MASVYDFEARTLDGNPVRLSGYAGQPLLIVNTASKCGFTPQYAGLEALFKRFGERGLLVLGFPCNQFGNQEPAGAMQIGEFCRANYGVSFPMFEKIEVNGANAHPLYGYLKHEARGILGTEWIKWNFTKFLVDRDGQVAARYASFTKPEALAPAIERLLA